MASEIDLSSFSSNSSSVGSNCHEHKMILEDEEGLEMDDFDTEITSPTELLEIDPLPKAIVKASSAKSDMVSLELNGEGVFLTWEDLWVTVTVGRSGCKTILQGLTGYAQPGEVLAIMGPSGCGKSTLLDALAGRQGPSTRLHGNMLVNGVKQTLAYGTSAYVTQDDLLMTTLTVEEAVYYSAQLQLPNSMSRLEKKERAEMTIKEMGLQDEMHTRIGGRGTKGISSGQKRRVSICIELLTHPKLLFLDEPTSGLDSAASYHVMKRIVNLAQQGGKTVITSIHQPTFEVSELFDNLCLLSCGRTIYFGAASAANEFFALNGFPCPTQRNPFDHYLRIINRDFDEDIEQGLGGRILTTDKKVDILVQSYKSSDTFQRVRNKITELSQKEGAALEKNGGQASFLTQCLVLTRRSFKNMNRDLGYFWLRFIMYILLCICLGTIFYDIGTSFGSIQARGSLLMFVATLVTFMSIAGFPSVVEDMKIFGRERLNGHYGVGAYVISNTLSSIPYSLLNAMIPGAVVYYLAGLQRGFEHYLYFGLLLFVCIMLVESLMMVVASIVSNFLLGLIVGAGIQGLMMINDGFFRLPNDIPKILWKYPVHYIAFHRYANQGFYKNEFEGLTFPNQAGGPPTFTGDEILRNVWQVQMDYSKWVDLAILCGMIVLYRLMFFLIVKAVEMVKSIVISFITVVPPYRQKIQTMESLHPHQEDL
ncbi:ABC transporter G family member 1-like [Macadamia integrifolia]|uniref:ABC transporter G family member 1-like n=1 Tax=Macadamia integrifolia TaxID=60698 RepID=UPI001C4F0D4D|nr:ABC transporter G family member 1-like [Macadamia integrifolia]